MRKNKRPHYPPTWTDELSQDEQDRYEYAPMTIPQGISRQTTTEHLSLESEYNDWELCRLRRYDDGTQKVMMRRRKKS